MPVPAAATSLVIAFENSFRSSARCSPASANPSPIRFSSDSSILSRIFLTLLLISSLSSSRIDRMRLLAMAVDVRALRLDPRLELGLQLADSRAGVLGELATSGGEAMLELARELRAARRGGARELGDRRLDGGPDPFAQRRAGRLDLAGERGGGDADPLLDALGNPRLRLGERALEPPLELRLRLADP